MRSRMKHSLFDDKPVTADAEFAYANVLRVEVGSNCPQGGDTGHGGRTYLSLQDRGGTDWRLRVTTHGGQVVEIDDAARIELIAGGDSERDTLFDAMRFAISTLMQPGDTDRLSASSGG